MGKWVHRLSDIDADSRTAVCSYCGPVKIKPYYDRPGHWRCNSRIRQVRTLRDKPWTLFKASVCERCGFDPEHECQLDVHHKDGNKRNNKPENLMTLCANCHRLITNDRRTS